MTRLNDHRLDDYSPEAARIGAGLTLRQVAERAGVSVSYVSDIERGRRNPQILVCERLIDLIREVTP